MQSSRPESAGPDGAAARPTHVADLVARAAAGRPDHEAIRDLATGASLTWAEFDAAVGAEERRLADAGVGDGDRVVVALPDGASFCVAVLGAMRAGAAAVPVGPG
ncbi:MAG: AMP-binding protein, partial [Actinomycetota bacterium]|nr:AMP-binding protein [Actinomycetota bacterium]